MPLISRSLAEMIGTFWLVLGGCGSAALAAVFMAGTNDIGIGLLGVAFAFGLTVVTMAYAIGHISGCHLNPAVTVGLVAGGRFSAAEAPMYILFQTIGAIGAAFLLLMILKGQPDFVLAANSLAVNGFGELSPGKYPMLTGFIMEVVMTAMFLFIILGATDKRGIGSHAGLAIGLALTLIHLISIPVTNTSVNPARSTGPALVLFLNGQGLAITQLWLFWAAPLIGGAIAGVVYRLFETNESK
ncbi:MAG: aquaporin Z [Lamprocystis purpurea]|jgi:aquaporin Z|uniref:aquaporin Z n=1 Tax=Lamprocystis purpurea TaxID=61598 RepID=UPI0003612BC7|nr:aquaporin Z [Lamprocystis purpurea]MBV5273242.1 aquaporin Z [Lamprocystis purpurea]